MPRCLALLAAAFILPLSLTAQQAASAPVPPSQKVLIHVHSANPKDWQTSVDKANSIMTTAPKGTAVVEILATGDGLKLVNKDGSDNAVVGGSLDKDVSYVACHASMKSNHMEIDQLHSGVGTVPSGGKEMVMKKAEGWTVLDDKNLQ